MPLPVATNSVTSASTSPRSIAQLGGPRGWPLLGNLPQLRPIRIHRDIEALCGRFGMLFRVWFGRQAVVVVADHKLIETILRDRPDGFRRPTVTTRISLEMGGKLGVFLAEGQAWRDQRRMVMAGLAPQAVKAYFPALLKVALRLRARWQGAASQGQTIILTDDLKRYSVDIAAGLALGTESNTVDGFDDGLHQHLEVVMRAVARRSLSILPYWRVLKLPADRQLDRSIVALRVTIDALIAAARERLIQTPARRARPPNLLEAMLCAADDPDSRIDDATVAGNVSTMLLAAEDTTANTIAWLLYLLQRHPAALERARNEVLRCLPDLGSASIEQLDALDYIDACAQEAMRLKPVAPFMPLEAVRDTKVGDMQLPAGTMVWCVMRHDSVSAQYFSQAQNFDPERWLRQGEQAVSKAVSLPFGAGPRTCPGRYLALLEIKLAVALLLGSFEIGAIDTVDGGEAQEVMGFTMSPMALQMRLRGLSEMT